MTDEDKHFQEEAARILMAALVRKNEELLNLDDLFGVSRSPPAGTVPMRLWNALKGVW